MLKQLFLTVLAVVLGLSLAACGQTEESVVSLPTWSLMATGLPIAFVTITPTPEHTQIIETVLVYREVPAKITPLPSPTPLRGQTTITISDLWAGQTLFRAVSDTFWLDGSLPESILITDEHIVAPIPGLGRMYKALAPGQTELHAPYDPGTGGMPAIMLSLKIVVQAAPVTIAPSPSTTPVVQVTSPTIAGTPIAPALYPVVATWTPVRPAQAQEDPELQYPRSASIEPGKAYPFQLYTHCGADLATDFDGSFWQLSNPAAVPASLGNPYQDGMMRLIDSDYARFDFAGNSLLFIRHNGPKHVLGCE